jgi:hypothetical protein
MGGGNVVSAVGVLQSSSGFWSLCVALRHHHVMLCRRSMSRTASFRRGLNESALMLADMSDD